MGGRHSKGKISQDDVQYLLKNTKHTKEEIKVTYGTVKKIDISQVFANTGERGFIA